MSFYNLTETFCGYAIHW